jgi:hypothetical protein
MHGLLIWNDVQGDFIWYRDPNTGKQWLGTEDEAMDLALMFIGRGTQARTQYVRQIQKTKKVNKNGRLRRWKAVQMDGQWVRVIATVDSNGKKVKS